MARLAERLRLSSYALFITLLFLGSCSKGPKVSASLSNTPSSYINGSIDNLGAFGLASAEEFRIYALNVEGVHKYAEVENDGTFGLRVPSNSLYMIYVLRDSNSDESFETHVATIDAVAGGALDLVPIYSDDINLGAITLPVGSPGSTVDLASNPALGRDMDGDSILDEVDDDVNGNGLLDTDDLLTLDKNENNLPNPIDSDRDGDTIANPQDPNQFDESSTPLPYEQDSDGDGIPDIYDVEPTSLYGSLGMYYVTGNITYIPPGEALTAVAITTHGRFIRSSVEENGDFNIPMREGSLFLLYFMNGNVVSNQQNISDFRGIVDPIAGGAPTALAMGRSNLNLGRITLPSNPQNRALNLNITILANRDSDGDGIRDSVDSDKDGNGIADATEALALNFDSDLLPNNLDTDDDNDGDLDGVDTDRDGDSLPDPIDTDGDGISDSNDIDLDNDGQLDGSNPTLVETPDLDVPISGSGIVFPTEHVQPNSIRVTWGAARDNATTADMLQYKVVAQEGASNLLDTALEAANLDGSTPGTFVVQPWTTNITQANATGLSYPQTYFFSVVVKDENNNYTLYTPQSQITVDSTAPVRGTAIITNPPAPGPNNIQVTWGTASDNISNPVNLEYKLVYSTLSTEIDTIAEADTASNVPMDWTAATTTFNVIGLSELTTYHFAVLVRDEAGNKALYSPASGVTTDVTAPVIADGPHFADVSDGSLTVMWDVASDNTTAEANLQYKVVKSVTPSGSDIDEIAEVNAVSGPDLILDWSTNTLSAAVTGLSQSTEYYFSVLVRDMSGNTSIYPPQSVITVNSSAPDITGVISFPSKTDTTVDLTWNEANDDITLQDDLQYKVVQASTATAIDTVAEADAIIGAGLVQDWTTDIQSITATGLSSGIRYYFTVLVRDDVLNTAIYAPQSVTTDDILAPTIGTGPTFASTTASQTTVNWTGSTDNTTTGANLQYKLVRSSDPQFIDEIAEANSAPSINFTVVMDWTTNTLTRLSSSLIDNTTYHYTVFVRDQAGNINIYPPQSVTTLDGTAPVIEVPTDNITFDTPLETEVTVKWGVAEDNATALADLEYKLVRASSSTAIDTLVEINAVSGAALILDWTAGSLLPTPPEFTATGLTSNTQYFFAVAVRDQSGFHSIYTPQSVTTAAPPNTGPTPGSNIVFSNTTDTRTTLTWGAASDNITPQASLQYKVVRGSPSTDLSTVEAAETNGTLVVDWTTNLLTRNVTNLSASQSYAFAVIVRDENSAKALYSPQIVNTSPPMKFLFVSNATFKGNFSISSLDSTCNSEGKSRFNSSKTYKAVIVNGTTRTRTTDWTLSANTRYKNKNSLEIGITSGSAIFSFPLSQAIDSDLGSNVYAWTGLNSDWSTSGNLCKNGSTPWASTSWWKFGQVGSPFSTSSSSIKSGSGRQCSSSSRIFCAEQ